MNRYLDNNILKLAKARNTWMFGHIRTMDKFGMCGVIDNDEVLVPMIKQFLTDNNIPFQFNDRNVIWLNDVKKSIQEVFKSK